MRNLRLFLITAITIALLIAGIYAGSLLIKRINGGTIDSDPNRAAVERVNPAPQDAVVSENPFLPAINATTVPSSGVNPIEIVFRLLVAVILAAILAFRPRKNVPLFRRNLYVAQTQILLAVVAAALMLIVGDNTARAFAIFAAVSLVRFRTNIKDPKEITVLLISLALGLASGVGRWDLGAILCVFAFILLWALEFKEPEHVYRSMELTVKTRDTVATKEKLGRIFQTHNLEAEIRHLVPPEPEKIGSIMYYINLRLTVSTDLLSEEILQTDAVNIEGIQWDQKKTSASVFQ